LSQESSTHPLSNLSNSSGASEPEVAAAAPDTFRGRTRLERAVLPYLREQTLWPVLVAVLAHIIALLAPLLVLGLRDGHSWSLLGVAVFATGSLVALGFELRERRRPGLVACFLAAVWCLCGAGAWAVMYFEIV
jgi:hypothetical protein